MISECGRLLSHSLSAANASDLLPNGPNTGPPTGPMSAHQKPSLSGSTWLARVICNLPSSRRSRDLHRTPDGGCHCQDGE